eukprot:7411323-Karenia_brevis.AAC.1
MLDFQKKLWNQMAILYDVSQNPSSASAVWGMMAGSLQQIKEPRLSHLQHAARGNAWIASQ